MVYEEPFSTCTRYTWALVYELDGIIAKNTELRTNNNVASVIFESYGGKNPKGFHIRVFAVKEGMCNVIELCKALVTSCACDSLHNLHVIFSPYLVIPYRRFVSLCYGSRKTLLSKVLVLPVCLRSVINKRFTSY